MLLNLVDQAKKLLSFSIMGICRLSFFFCLLCHTWNKSILILFFLFISTYYKSEIAKNTIRVLDTCLVSSKLTKCSAYLIGLCVVMANIKGNRKSALLFRIAILFFIFFKFKECILIFLLFFFCKYTLKHLYVHFL